MTWTDLDQSQTWGWHIQPGGQTRPLVLSSTVLGTSFWRHLLFFKKKSSSNLFQWKKIELTLSSTLRNLAWKSLHILTPNNRHCSAIRQLSWFWLVGRAEPVFLEVNQSNKLMWNSFVRLHFLMLYKDRLWRVLGSGKNYGEYFLGFQSQWRI